MGRLDDVSTDLLKDDTQVLAQAAQQHDTGSQEHNDLHRAINNNLTELDQRTGK